MAHPHEARLSILVLTEDSGKDAHHTLEALGKKLLRLVHDPCQTQRVHFEPANDAARAATRANLWKSPRQHRERVDLLRHIANKIRETRGFVFFHVDGDRVWSERDTSENREKFQHLVVDQVRRILAAGGRRGQTIPEPDIESALGRLFLLMPFYSIEAWLYQNTHRAESLCQTHHRGQDAERFQHWRDHRHEIDEQHKPKHRICLADKHNLDLARTAYPAREAYDAGTSFRHTADLLRRSIDLAAALADTCEANPPDPE